MQIMSGAFIETWLPFIVAGLIQASFGLAVGMLTLLSGHSLFKRRSNAKLMRLSGAYVGGAMLAILLMLTFLVYIFSIENARDLGLVWAIICGASAGIGIAVMLFYYRRGRGTMLWLPRAAAEVLYKRTKRASTSFEAFLIGVGAIILELIFIIAPMLIAAILLASSPSLAQLIGILLYVLIASAPLLVLLALLGSGHQIASLQKWREKNKTFLQISAGAGLVILAIYLFVFNVLVAA